jgi:hypothetical protein
MKGIWLSGEIDYENHFQCPSSTKERKIYNLKWKKFHRKFYTDELHQ